MHAHTPSPTPIAAVYVRSAAYSAESIEAQLLVCRTAAERHGYSLSEEYVYVDNGVSGLTTDRPGWLRMLRDAEREGGAPFHVLLVTERTRIGRFHDPRTIEYRIVRFEHLGVRVEYAHGSHAAAPRELLGELRKLSDRSGTATADRRRTARRPDAAGGRRPARLRRVDRFFASPPYGFARVPEEGDTAEDSRTAARTGDRRLAPATDGSVAVVQRIFDRLADGASLGGVAADLNADEIPTPPGGASRWTPGRISQIARNPIYVGDVVLRRMAQDGGPLTVAGYVASPPISRALFDQVQRRLRRG